MTVVSSVVAGVVALFGVLLGGFLTIRNQDRLWAREHDRQWRDVRREVFEEFVTAYRAMLAYVSSPEARVTSADHPRRPGEEIPYFSEEGRQLREQLEVALTKIRLVARSDETVRETHRVVFALRDLAAARAKHAHDEMPDELFRQLFVAQQRFLTAARGEMNLPEIPDRGREPDLPLPT